jgi:hypothetical protein
MPSFRLRSYQQNWINLWEQVLPCGKTAAFDFHEIRFLCGNFVLCLSVIGFTRWLINNPHYTNTASIHHAWTAGAEGWSLMGNNNSYHLLIRHWARNQAQHPMYYLHGRMQSLFCPCLPGWPGWGCYKPLCNSAIFCWCSWALCGDGPRGSPARRDSHACAKSKLWRVLRFVCPLSHQC